MNLSTTLTASCDVQIAALLTLITWQENYFIVPENAHWRIFLCQHNWGGKVVRGLDIPEDK